MYSLYYFKKVSSTNDKIKDFEKEGTVVIAEQQIKGRGRFKRKWSSGKNGLWFSILLKPKNIEKLSFLNFCAAISCQKAIKKITGIRTKLKWPNDLIFMNKKLCGILTESSLGKENLVYLGIGINTNNKIPKDLGKIAISVYKIINKKIDNKKLLKNILDYFDNYYKEYQK